MYCTNCGKKLEDEASVCTYCGKEVDTDINKDEEAEQSFDENAFDEEIIESEDGKEETYRKTRDNIANDAFVKPEEYGPTKYERSTDRTIAIIGIIINAVAMFVIIIMEVLVYTMLGTLTDFIESYPTETQEEIIEDEEIPEEEEDRPSENENRPRTLPNYDHEKPASPEDNEQNETAENRSQDEAQNDEHNIKDEINEWEDNMDELLQKLIQELQEEMGSNVNQIA